MHRSPRSRYTAAPPVATSSSATTASMGSEMRYLEHQVSVLEGMYQGERRQRDVLEKKYARLKRRYIRLERAHARVVLETHEMYRSSSSSSNDVLSDHASAHTSQRITHTNTASLDRHEYRSTSTDRTEHVAQRPSIHTATRSSVSTTTTVQPPLTIQHPPSDRSASLEADVIDLTSTPPNRTRYRMTATAAAAIPAATRQRNETTPSPVTFVGLRTALQPLATDFIAASPDSTPDDSYEYEDEEVDERIALRHAETTATATPTSTTDRYPRQQWLDRGALELTTAATTAATRTPQQQWLDGRAVSSTRSRHDASYALDNAAATTRSTSNYSTVAAPATTSAYAAAGRPRPRLGMIDDAADRRLRRAMEQEDRDYDHDRRRRQRHVATNPTFAPPLSAPPRAFDFVSQSPRRTHNFASAPVRATTTAAAANAAPMLSTAASSSVASSPTTMNSSPHSSPRAFDNNDNDNDNEEDSDVDNDAASLALAQYLQQQENIAAFHEYEARARVAAAEREQRLTAVAMSPLLPPLPTQRTFDPPPLHHHNHHPTNGHRHPDIDPDNMTYDELLQLGEQNGDVRKERWRAIAVHVMSTLPTHRWSGGHDSDVSCIICQYSFMNNDRALTLPCAHVFHEECVDGWIRENNSCPLCKLEIASM